MVPAAPPSSARLQRLWPALLATFVGLYACAWIGSISAPSMVKRDPELLLALSSRIRHLLFAVPAGISVTSYAVIGFGRLMLAAIVCFLLGRAVGDRLFNWFDAQTGGDRPLTLRWAEKAVHGAATPLVVLFPGSNIVCFLAGRRMMGSGRFVLAASAGIGFRLVWVWFAAKQFESQLATALDFIDRYQRWFIIALVVMSIVPGMRKTFQTEKLRRQQTDSVD